MLITKDKNMKTILFLLLIIPNALWSQTTDEAVAYNDKLIAEQDKIGYVMLDLMNSLGQETSTYENSENLRLELIKTINQSLKAVNKMGSFGGSSELKNATVSLFEYYKRVVENEYKEMLTILYKDELTEDDNARLEELLEQVTAEEAKYDDAFQAAQQKFALKYNIELQENEMQELLDGE